MEREEKTGGAVKQKKSQKMKNSLIHVTLLNF
jgi:hypothetical protein